MNIIDFIETKKSGRQHTADEISEFIKLLVDGKIPDYQAAAWLMAVNFNGLDPDETVALTKAIVASGDVAEYIGLPGPVVDKHSTGGVGDKVTPVLLPILAEMGMFIPKHSGRSLGFTGGTIDKLESIPGFNAYLPEDQFRANVREVGFAISGQTLAMCPADGILYALRDATDTVEETGLIASSVMSKKIAGGADYILLDVKVGKGAFMKDEASARTLAERMIFIGNKIGKKVCCLLTRMEQPLGNAVGNTLEVIEAISCLKGEGPADLMEVVKEAAVELATITGLYTKDEALTRFDACIASGAALRRLKKFITAQDGETGWMDNPEGLLEYHSPVDVPYHGAAAWVVSLDALAIGELARIIGAGRLSKEDKIDYSVGIILKKKIGDPVSEGDILASVYLNPAYKTDEIIAAMRDAYTFGAEHPVVKEIVIGRMR